MKVVLDRIRQLRNTSTKGLAVLIDPDEVNADQCTKLVLASNKAGVDFFFLGGSLITQAHTKDLIKIIKDNSRQPIVLFPGSNLHIEDSADAILFLSLISGRNPEYLIGQHVIAAPVLKRSSLEIMPTGYLLVGNDTTTTVAYISHTHPIPAEKTDIAVCTALAGEMLGHQLIYLDAGSGAAQAVSPQMIREVKKAISLPLIIGGGIDSPSKASKAWEAGADLIVIGNALEKDPSLLTELYNIKSKL